MDNTSTYMENDNSTNSRSFFVDQYNGRDKRIPYVTEIPRLHLAKNSDSVCILMTKKGSFTQVDPRQLNNKVLIPSRRVQLDFRSDEIIFKKAEDQAVVTEFFGCEPVEYFSWLLDASGDIDKTLQSLGWKNRFTSICIHKCCYRINTEKEFFNILVEWCGIVPNVRRMNQNFR